MTRYIDFEVDRGGNVSGGTAFDLLIANRPQQGARVDGAGQRAAASHTKRDSEDPAGIVSGGDSSLGLQDFGISHAAGSGTVWARSLLERIFPLDASCDSFTDSTCIAMAPNIGDVETIAAPLGSIARMAPTKAPWLRTRATSAARSYVRLSVSLPPARPAQ